jgi:hypothetical protein
MLRAVTAGIALGNAEWTTDNSGAPYPGIDWVNANVDDGSPAGSLLGIYGGWYRNAVEARIGHTPRATETVRDIEVGDSSYCGAYCHTTGPNAWDAPANFFGTAISGTSFVATGVQCTRCHDHSADGVTTDADPADEPFNPGRHHDDVLEGVEVTELCYECHEQSGVAPFEVHTSPSSFIGHYRTNQFLNSPHARFSGSDAEDIADTGMYDTHFDGGCTECHDVHIGAVDPSNLDQNHIVQKCGIDCHAPQTACPPWNPSCDFVNYDGYSGFHDGWGDPAPDTTTAAGITGTNPTGAGTNPDGCVSCHMGPGTNHLFRNSVDADYDPFSADPCPPEDFWTDLEGYDACASGIDQVCGQCHYSPDGIAQNKFLKHELAVFAYNYHNDPDLHGGEFAAPGDVSAHGARFNWYQGAACYEINLDATDNDASMVGWDCGGAVTTDAVDTDKITSCVYAAAGSYPVTLSTAVGARTMVVVAKAVNAQPDSFFDVFFDLGADPTGMTVTVDDDTTLNACDVDGTCDVVIFWGDGTTSVLGGVTAGDTGIVSHTYSVPGIYTMGYSCEDSSGNKSMAQPVTLTVPDATDAVCDVNGTIADVIPPYGTMITIWETTIGESIIARGSTCSTAIGECTGAQRQILCEEDADCPATETCDFSGCPEDGYFSIPNINAGRTYTVVPSRNGYTFSATGAYSYPLQLECGTNNADHDFDAISTW